MRAACTACVSLSCKMATSPGAAGIATVCCRRAARDPPSTLTGRNELIWQVYRPVQLTAATGPARRQVYAALLRAAAAPSPRRRRRRSAVRMTTSTTYQMYPDDPTPMYPPSHLPTPARRYARRRKDSARYARGTTAGGVAEGKSSHHKRSDEDVQLDMYQNEKIITPSTTAKEQEWRKRYWKRFTMLTSIRTKINLNRRRQQPTSRSTEPTTVDGAQVRACQRNGHRREKCDAAMPTDWLD